MSPYHRHHELEAPPVGVGLRIGLVADSQFQTERAGDYVPLLKGKFEDQVWDLTIRPPALDRLSRALLEDLLGRLAEDWNVDVVLFLGDGANNGCRDELESVFGVLRAFRSRSGVPIYFLIGNHDYLGAGNTTFLSDRRQLCDREARGESARNLPVTKFELIRMASELNHENSGLGTWSYQDNFHGNEEMVFDTCVTNLPEEPGAEDPQHAQPGCYLAGKLTRDVAGRRQEILLTDTSDYHGKGVLYRILGKQFLAIAGWMSTHQEPSTPPSQARWFGERREPGDGPPEVRFIASHYPPDMLGLLPRRLPWKGVLSRIGGLMLPDPVMGNYWLYAHTHRLEMPREFELDLEGGDGSPRVTVRSIGVGSTTDFGRSKNEPPHALVVSIANDRLFSFDVVTPQSSCGDLIESLREFTRVRREGEAYRPVKDRFRGAALLGVDRSYRDADWLAADKENALVNLARYLEELEADGVDRHRAELCLAIESSRREELR
jgi:hypothetical protein